MKKITLILMAFAASTIAFAQNRQVDEFFKKYEGKEGYTSVMISEKLFELVASAAPESEAEITDMIGELQGIRVLVYDQEDAYTKSAELYKEASSAISLDAFDELLTVYDEGDKVRLLVRQDPANKEVINELLILVSGDEFVLVDIFGQIDLSKISKLADSMDIEGLDELKNLDK
ncbi:MAG: DUF4252 domain-containing protein [Chitinophagales bacterium]|nr:DUF4252 domain-containing protein [Bacteroidota bacterium]MBP7398763.1 DUF4252 domain-containing protein [Chitinophagales bacterium]MBK8682687.1 DUF4252 domain-containing protein [Bacteroidota bacterium]MBP8753746.1 DUF4252 domain-containing protein [Chitinophagales bacterium]MBP9189226.1 DUF4252 domain-containing protein [Chitinophagales bacterium]